MEYWRDPELVKKIRKRRKKPKVGDYVLASRWPDLDSNDPWYVSFVKKIIINSKSTSYVLEDHGRYWKNARIITKEEGHEILGY